VKYAKNNANGQFQKVIQITHANAAAYDSDYVIGLSGDAAELMWTRANVLWDATRQIESPPRDMTNLDWCVKDSDAVWYLDTWLSWMGAKSTDGTVAGVVFEPKKRLSFTVPYATGLAWFITKHLNVQFPHQTNDVVIECVIETMSKSLAKGSESVTVQVVLYGAETEIPLYIQDTFTAGTLLDDWQDSMDTKAQEASQGEDVQDIT